MSNYGDEDHDHLSEVDDGAGCTEIWEELSERRERQSNSRGSNVEMEGNAK